MIWGAFVLGGAHHRQSMRTTTACNKNVPSDTSGPRNLFWAKKLRLCCFGNRAAQGPVREPRPEPSREEQRWRSPQSDHHPERRNGSPRGGHGPLRAAFPVEGGVAKKVEGWRHMQHGYSSAGGGTAASGKAEGSSMRHRGARGGLHR